MPRLSDLPAPTTPDCVLDHAGILAILPHRHPFLFVDRLLEFESRKRAVGLKLASFGEPHFSGHFPVATILILVSFEGLEGKRPAFIGIEKTRFRQAVRPGDVLRLEVDLLSWRRGMGTAQGRVVVGGKLACETEILATMV